MTDSPVFHDPTEHDGHRFDVQPSHPAAAENYPVSAVLPQPVGPRRKVWRRSLILNQGQEGACVGHGTTAELTGSPARVNFAHARKMPSDAPHQQQPFAFYLYEQAKKVDEYPGEDYDGTSINAAMQLCKAWGFYDAYRWAHTRQDFTQSLMLLGPVVIAIPWHEGMYEAPGGELTVSGKLVGYHCLVVNGYDPALSVNGEPVREMVRIQNSWGYDWGNQGCAWMHLDDLWPLLSGEGGEMCIPQGRHLGA